MTDKLNNMLHTRFPDKFCSAADAVKKITPDNCIFIGSGAAQPEGLVREMMRQAERIRRAEIIHILTLGSSPYIDAKYSNVFRHNAFFIGKNVRDAVRDGRADYTAVFLSEIPRLFYENRCRPDVALIRVSAPDEHGYVSLGVSVDIVKAACDTAKVIIAEINPRMPYTYGDGFMHLNRAAHITLQDEALPELIPEEPDAESMAIGRHVAELVEDGATLQMGIGGIPNAVLKSLTEKNDLGIHTEMFSDGLIDLIDRGNITCARKTLHRGKVITSFCFGSRRLYDYIHRNPLFEFHPSDYVNRPSVIAQNERMTAVNSALEVDLTGQVCADSIGYSFYSGIGGQVDFIRGAAMSKGGKPIIALKSTAKSGKVSRVVPVLKEGAGVVTTRGDVHWVVTEFGAADLWGKNMRERVAALISIAHPDFRGELASEAKSRHLT